MAKSKNQILIVTLICAAAILVIVAASFFTKSKNSNPQTALVPSQTNLKCSADASWTVDRDSVKELVDESASIIAGTIKSPDTPENDVRYSSIKVERQLKGSFFAEGESVNLCIPLRTESDATQKAIVFLKGTDADGRWVPIDGWNGAVYEKMANTI